MDPATQAAAEAAGAQAGTMIVNVATANEIRHWTYADAKAGHDSEPHAALFWILQEIAAQLAEANERGRQEVADAKAFREQLGGAQGHLQQTLDKMAPPEPPPIPPTGTVITCTDGLHFGIVIEGGFIKAITEDEANELIAAQKKPPVAQ